MGKVLRVGRADVDGIDLRIAQYIQSSQAAIVGNGKTRTQASRRSCASAYDSGSFLQIPTGAAASRARGP